ncbi:MAG: hypothetical protein QMD01_06290 [Thermodesulfovibrionales bacterium]|nr:hypothetical protein [Thermodesulfovibrionales bacterium]
MYDSVIKNSKGFALVAALVVMTLLAALGSAAYMMTQLGFSAVTAERKYQLANWSADYAISAGASHVVENAVCPPSTSITPCASLESGASCTYFSIPDATGTFCIIYGKGQFRTGENAAKVMKTAVVPRVGSDWAGMVTRGGTITLSGSSAIAGCDDDEANYDRRCGMMPGLIAPLVDGTNMIIDISQSTVSEVCKSEGKLKGLFGNPPHYPRNLPNDLTSKYFNVEDGNGNGTAWDEFLGILEGKYSVNLKDISNNAIPPSISGVSVAPTADDDCNFTGTGSCITLSSTNIKCDGGEPTEKTIILTKCAQVYLNSSGVTLSEDIGNKTILSVSNVTIGASSNSLSVISNGAITVNANLKGATISALGNINFSTGINDLSMQNSKFISGDTIFLGCASTTFGCASENNRFDGTLTNTNLFSDNLSMNFTATSEVAGGTLYARTSTGINSNGKLNIGTVANPILLLAGSTSLSVPGNPTINGLIYTSAANISITGAVEIQGALINNSTSANISNTGNGVIQFNKQVLDTLYTTISDLMNKPKCGGGNKNDWIENTKMTLY